MSNPLGGQQNWQPNRPGPQPHQPYTQPHQQHPAQQQYPHHQLTVQQHQPPADDPRYRAGAAPTYQNTLLPVDFVIPHGATPQSPIPQYQPEPGQTGIVVETSYFPWTFPYAYLLALTGPTILVNGQVVPETRWGTTYIPVPPGLYHVRVYLRKSIRAMLLGVRPMGSDFGFADAMIPVAEGHRTSTHYRGPMVPILNGALAPQQPRSPGRTWFLIVWAIVLMCILLAITAILTN
ncbi:hypothetical protein [Nocardia sp. NPDC051463]|uniref:hypothetical protein n=1 Tax=Nocardia sp. NPDC051463 TaxID=3154845 RepID=UPI00344BA024